MARKILVYSPLSVNFWDCHPAQFLKKKIKNACDVRVGTKKIKLYAEFATLNQNDCGLIFSRNTLGDDLAFRIFARIHG